MYVTAFHFLVAVLFYSAFCGFFCVQHLLWPGVVLKIEKPNKAISSNMTVISCRVMLVVYFSFYISSAISHFLWH